MRQLKDLLRRSGKKKQTEKYGNSGEAVKKGLLRRSAPPLFAFPASLLPQGPQQGRTLVAVHARSLSTPVRRPSALGSVGMHEFTSVQS